MLLHCSSHFVAVLPEVAILSAVFITVAILSVVFLGLLPLEKLFQ